MTKHTISFSEGFQTYPEISGEPDFQSECEHYNEQRIEKGMPELTEEQQEKLADVYDFSFSFNLYRIDVSNAIEEFLLESVAPILKPFGLIVKGGSFYTPRAYNFECDSCDITFEVDLDTLQSRMPELKPHLEKYFNEVMQKSCSGYISLEPECIADIDFSDSRAYSAILWAILERTGEQELKSELEDMLYDNAYNFYIQALDWEAIEAVALS